MQHLKSKFIVLDGPEGCGKSTQGGLLAEALRGSGLGVLEVRDPGATRIGEQVRALLLNPDHGEMGMRCEMLLYMAARAQMMHEAVLPALEAGRVVVCDRFVSSTLAYQLGGDGLTAAEIRSIADVAIRARWPDLTVILDIDPARAFERVKRDKDRIEQRPIEYHRRVRENYLSQVTSDPARYRVVPADRTRDEVAAEVWRTVQARFGDDPGLVPQDEEVAE